MVVAVDRAVGPPRRIVRMKALDQWKVGAVLQAMARESACSSATAEASTAQKPCHIEFDH